MRLRATLLLPFLFAATATAAPPPAASKVEAELLADVSTLKPGDSFTLAVTLTTQSHWHIYWRNPGDSGTPTHFSLKLPEGFKADTAAFPLPEKFTQPGDLIAYGYTGVTTFLIRVTTPPTVHDSANITVNASWLCCNDQLCVPGKQTLNITIPVASSSTLANKELFDKASAQIPADAPPSDVTIKPTATNLTTTASPMSFDISWKQKVQNVEAFPLAVDGLELSNLTVAHQDTQSKLTASARILSGQHLGSDRQEFLITYTDAAGVRHGFYTAVPLSAAADLKK